MPVMMRNGASGDRAHDVFLVEGPEVFERAATARQDQDIDELLAVEILDRRFDFAGRAFALHADGIDDEMEIGEAAAQDAHNVAHGRAARRGDQADALGQHGKGLLALDAEQAFGVQALFQLLEGELERAETDRLDVLDVDLILAALLVDADGAAYGDVQAVFRAEFEAHQLGAKADAADLRAGVLEREVEMAGLGRVGVGNFALDEDSAELSSEQVANARGQIADRPDFALGHQR